MLDAFDADVLIYAAAPGHQFRARLLELFEQAESDNRPAGIGSVLLLPELLSKPMRHSFDDQVDELEGLLARLDLRPVDAQIAHFATAIAATYGLRAVDAVHLATAVNAGADRFITNNRKDFSKSIAEIDVTYPEDLLPD